MAQATEDQVRLCGLDAAKQPHRGARFAPADVVRATARAETLLARERMNADRFCRGIGHRRSMNDASTTYAIVADRPFANFPLFTLLF